MDLACTKYRLVLEHWNPEILDGPNMARTKFGWTKYGTDQIWLDQMWDGPNMVPDQIWVGPKMGRTKCAGPNLADQKWPTKSVSTKSVLTPKNQGVFQMKI